MLWLHTSIPTPSPLHRSQLRFLVALLSRNPLPEIVPHSRTCCSPSLPGSANYPFRVQLLRFLLLCGSSEEDTASAAVVETSWINRYVVYDVQLHNYVFNSSSFLSPSPPPLNKASCVSNGTCCGCSDSENTLLSAAVTAEAAVCSGEVPLGVWPCLSGSW